MHILLLIAAAAFIVSVFVKLIIPLLAYIASPYYLRDTVDMSYRNSLTPIEVLAEARSMKASYRFIGEKEILERLNRKDSSFNPWADFATLPLIAKIGALVVDIAFLISISALIYWAISTEFIYHSTIISSWVGAGLAVFFYHTIIKGQIGAPGYHVQLLLLIIAWPLFILLICFSRD